jgi:putative polyketide hydroxylase
MGRVNLSRNCEVLVAGAGPGGLVAAITLARYGIDMLLIDKRATPSGLSRALVTSPTRPAWAAQDHHEPIMLEHLRSLPSARIRLGCELLQVTQDDSGVRATVADAGTGAVEDVGASFLIAADGAHSTVRGQLGISMAGSDSLADYERVEFTAPLWQLAGKHRYGLYVITRPDAAGVLAPRGHGDRWFLARETPVGTRGLAGLSHEDLTDLILRAAGTDTLRPQIERVSTWTFAAQLAERYAQGRCFLAGDAAHRATPRGGTGMNTAIQDSFDLGWKLAWVLRGWASPDLLATYEPERRPVAAHNVQRSSEPGGARRETDEALTWDLGGRLPHHWLPAGDQERSTVDLIGEGLTLLAGPSDPRWARITDTVPSSPPIDVHVLDARTADALGLPPAGALLARPDGRELRRWTDLDTAAAAGAEGLAIATPRPQ